MEDGRLPVGTLRDIIRGRNRSVEVITEKELGEAFRRLGYQSEVHARNIFADIKKHREPEWHEGDVVRDADGFVWERHGDGWGKPKGGGSGFWGHGFPSRPLTRLVEEG